MKSSHGKWLVAGLLLLILQYITFGHQDRISGVVVDPNGALVTGASVVLSCEGKTAQEAVSDAEGRFSFSANQSPCRLTVSKEGFETYESVALVGEQTVRMTISAGRMTVTAETGRAENRDNVPQALTLISSETIGRRGVTVLAQLADEEVGVSLQRTSPTIGAVAVRGLTGKNVSVYIDGVRFTNSAQRGGINTFFNLTDASQLESVEVIRGASSAQYGSDSLGGTVNLITKGPARPANGRLFTGEFSTGAAYADLSYGSSATISFGNDRLAGNAVFAGRRANSFRPAGGIDSHAAVTRFLGLPSDIFGSRLSDTAFTQYSGSLRLDAQADPNNLFTLKYQRSQQDGGKRRDLTAGGDGNLIADLRNLMGDLAYLRFNRQGLGVFDSGSFTVSYNSQREERVNQGGQGNPSADVIHQYERTSVLGISFFLNKEFGARSSLLVGGDSYFEGINSPAFTYRPTTATFVLSRPRVPDEARYRTSGVFVQGTTRFVSDRIRVSGALRYNYASYRALEKDSPTVAGVKLWSNDSLSAEDFSGRIGVVAKIVQGLNLAFNYSRGFRYPSMTDLGTLGLTGDGFEVDHTAASALGGTIGGTASADAVSTGLPVERQRSEYSNSYDVSIRYFKKRFDTDLTVFYLNLRDTITKQALILPLGSVGRMLGDQEIISQNPNGTVFVGLSSSPVLVRANFTSARLYGFEYEVEAAPTNRLELKANYTYIRAEDEMDGTPPSIEGGTPPPQGTAVARYDIGERTWIEGVASFADRQDRLSALDLTDRRTGATRSRTQIANFFRRGACVYGLTNNPDGLCGTGDETVLLRTGESIAQVQNRVLGNGVNSAPMFRHLPGFVLFGVRGGFKLNEHSQISWSVENIFDRFHRKPSWGIDGPGRNLKIQYRVRF